MAPPFLATAADKVQAWQWGGQACLGEHTALISQQSALQGLQDLHGCLFHRLRRESDRQELHVHVSLLRDLLDRVAASELGQASSLRLFVGSSGPGSVHAPSSWATACWTLPTGWLQASSVTSWALCRYFTLRSRHESEMLCNCCLRWKGNCHWQKVARPHLQQGKKTPRAGQRKAELPCTARMSSGSEVRPCAGGGCGCGHV